MSMNRRELLKSIPAVAVFPAVLAAAPSTAGGIDLEKVAEAKRFLDAHETAPERFLAEITIAMPGWHVEITDNRDHTCTVLVSKSHKGEIWQCWDRIYAEDVFDKHTRQAYISSFQRAAKKAGVV